MFRCEGLSCKWPQMLHFFYGLWSPNTSPNFSLQNTSSVARSCLLYVVSIRDCALVLYDAMFLLCTVFGRLRLLFTLITEGDQRRFSEVLNGNRLCAASQSPRTSWQRRSEDAHQLRTSEPGGGRLASRHESAGCAASLFTSAPPTLHLRLWDCCKETLSRRGRRRHLPHLSSLFFFDHLHITPSCTQPASAPSTPLLSVKERKTDICIASSCCTRFIWDFWISIERAEGKKKYFFVELIFCCLSFFFSFF